MLSAPFTIKFLYLCGKYKAYGPFKPAIINKFFQGYYFTIPLKPVKKTQPIKLLFVSRVMQLQTTFDKLVKAAKENKIEIDYSKFVQELIHRAISLYRQLALEKANSVKGLNVNSRGVVYSFGQNNEQIINDLARVYEELIGSFDRFILEKESRGHTFKK